MGQRLNLEIRTGEKVLANAYFHWSAYTSSTNSLLIKMITELENPDSPIHSIEDLKLKAIRLLEVTGAKLQMNEIEDAAVQFEGETFEIASNRSDGLINFIPEGMAETVRWAEGDAYLDITNLTAENNCFFLYDHKEAYLSETDSDEEEYEDDVKDLSNQKTEIGELDFLKFRAWSELCDTVSDEGFSSILINDGSIISFVE